MNDTDELEDTANQKLSIPEIAPDTDNLRAALAYVEAGWYVLPVKRGTKQPGSIVREHWQDKSSRDPKQIAAWFAGTDHDIALHCGRSGAVAFDVDRPANLPEVLRRHIDSTPYQSTRPDQPERGHYVFTVPPGRAIGNSGGKLGKSWGEVRGLNGVIIVAPSHHDKGGEYRWQQTGAVPVLPDEVSLLLPDGSPAEDAATDKQVKAFLEKHCDGDIPGALLGPVRWLEMNIHDDESRHDNTVSAVVWAMDEAAAGCYSADDAQAALREVFISSLGQQRKHDDRVIQRRIAGSEFDGMLAWAIGQANAKDADGLATIRAKVQKRTSGMQGCDGQSAMDRAAIDSIGPISLLDAHTVFRRWLGDDYDADAIDAVLAAVAVERFNDGSDPLWLLLVSGSGNAKTETVQSLNGIGATIVSAISSDAALLSGTPKRDRTKSATGGLLRKIGERGVLVIKDVTSILSMDRNLRAKVLAALREVYDGYWVRDIGTDGGQHMDWKGRIAVIGAVTTAWDTAYSVIATMGDRFALVRMDSTVHREAAGRTAIRNTGSESMMRAELAAAAAGVIAGMSDPITLTEAEAETLLKAADLVTLARTAVEFDYRGDVIDAHAPEMPTRFAKQLSQVLRGAVAIGMDRKDALRLAIRVARDSMPPLRRAIIEDLVENPDSTASDVRKRINKPRSTVDRQLQALHMLGIATVEELRYEGKTHWHYTLSNDIDPKVLEP